MNGLDLSGVIDMLAGLRNLGAELAAGGERRRAALAGLFALIALLAFIPLAFLALNSLPYFDPPSTHGVVSDKVDSAGRSLLTYKTAIGEEKEFYAPLHISGDAAPLVCQTALGRAYLCSDRPALQKTFWISFTALMACAGYLTWLFYLVPKMRRRQNAASSDGGNFP